MGIWGRESRDLSAAFSRLAQSSFEGAFAWGLDAESLRKITEILDKANADIDGVRKGGTGGGKSSKPSGDTGTVKDEEE
jgi:hypothetical protein